MECASNSGNFLGFLLRKALLAFLVEFSYNTSTGEEWWTRQSQPFCLAVKAVYR
jgi:hypothetical protein